MNRIHHKSNSQAQGFTRIDAMVVTTITVVVLLLLIALVLPPLSAVRDGPGSGYSYMKNISQLRGIHQSMVIFAQNNNTYLPGLNSSGNILPADAKEFTSAPGNTLTGASMAARYYILLNGSFIAGDLLINPRDTLTKWSTSTALPTTDQFSYAALRIGMGSQSTDIGHHKTRASEWRDNANSEAILLSDRNNAPTPTAPRSPWSTSSTGPDWKGTVLWGDDHAEFLNAPNARLGPLSLPTKYADTINSNDFLFGEFPLPGKSATASAMFGYTSQNF